MQVIDRGGYSREEILEVLHSKENTRNIRFRYDLLNREGYFKKELDSVVRGEVSMSAFSTIKRTAKFQLKENLVPERFEDAQESTSKNWNNPSSWNEGTHNGTVLHTNAIRITTPNTSVLTDSGFETLGVGSGNSAGLSTEWITWGNPALPNPQRGTYAQALSGGIYRWGQQLTRIASGSFGMTTAKTNTVTLTNGQTVYVSFFFKPSNANFNDPNYCYLISNTAGQGNIPLNVYTITDLGNGWFRFDTKYTSVSSTLTNYSILIGWNGGTNGDVWVDNVYINNGTPPTYIAEWTSQPIKATNGERGGISESNVNWATRLQFNSKVTVYSRWSTNGSTNWSTWLVQSNNTQISGLGVGTSVEEVWVQFRVVIERYDINSETAFIDSLNFTLGRTYSIYVPETTEVNYLTDRIQPHMEVRMNDGRWIAFPLGVFLLSSPTRTDGVNGSVYREIEAYDGLIILDEDKFTSRYVIRAGTKYTTGVTDILASSGVTNFTIEDSNLVLTNDIEFATGISKLEAVNELLRALNYTPMWVDANGYFVAYPYISPASRATDYTYEDNELSVTFNGMEEELDIYSIPNVWVVTQSNPEKTPFTSRLTNDKKDSPTSTVNMGRNIVDFREIDEIANQATLDAYVQRIAFEASQVFGKLKFETALMPFHEYSDVLRVRYAPLKIDHTFSETSWTMPLEVGGKMVHEARRVVNI